MDCLARVRRLTPLATYPDMKSSGLLLVSLLLLPALRAELKLPAIIGDHMVLQQQQANPIWGWDRPGARVTVALAGQTHTTTAGADGRWTVRLAPLAASATPQTMTISGSSRRELRDILVGEVWMCSGQSNMEWSLAQSYHGDLEALATDLPQVRLITVPRVGTPKIIVWARVKSQGNQRTAPKTYHCEA